MSRDQFHEGWKEGIGQAIIEAENDAMEAPTTEVASLHRAFAAKLRKLLADAASEPPYTLSLAQCFGDVMTRADWLNSVRSHFFIDDDGYGYPVRDGKAKPTPIYPSGADKLPKDATHVVWFNK